MDAGDTEGKFMNNKMIGKCELCEQDYCQECSGDDYEWRRFCSPRCDREAAEQLAEESARKPKPRRKSK